MAQTHHLLGIIEETLFTLRNLAEKGARGFDCSERGLSLCGYLNPQRADDGCPEKLPVLGSPAREEPFPGTVPPLSAAPAHTPAEPHSPPAPLRAESLEEIVADIGDCRRCKLSQHRSRIVFGEGSPSARLMFVGEAPGFDEDQQGKPFVGKAGQLLTRIIQAIHLSREEVYICNVIKCRPPGNRNPEPDEIVACSPFLNRQIAVIRPAFICALGTFAAQTLIKTTQPISRLRGRFYDYQGIQLLPTFHPSYLLRNPEKKRDVWEDMKLLMNEMDL